MMNSIVVNQQISLMIIIMVVENLDSFLILHRG